MSFFLVILFVIVLVVSTAVVPILVDIIGLAVIHWKNKKPKS